MLNTIKAVWKRRQFISHMIRAQLLGDVALQLPSYLWWILEPLAQTAVYSLVIVYIFHRGGPDLPFFIMVGVLPFRWTTNGVADGIGSIRRYSGIIQSAYIPKAVFPVIQLGASFVRFLVALGLVGALTLAFGGTWSWSLTILPLAILIHAFFNIGLTLVLSHFGVYVPDTRNVWQIVSRLWFYLSPVVYALSQVPQRWAFLWELNPMVALLSLYRWAFLAQEPPQLKAVGWLIGFTLGLVLWGTHLHNKYDSHYAKVI